VTATGNFATFLSWLSARNAVAFFNHPGKYDQNGKNSYNSGTTPSLKIVGMEMWNNTDGFSRYYYNTGYITGDDKGNYDEALANGWIIGVGGSGDDHSGTWGTAENYRMAILADSLTRDNLFAAMKARRFYSTLESDIRLSFKINGQEMGSAIATGSYTVQIEAEDGGAENFTKVVLYDKNHNSIKTWLPCTSSFTINDTITTVAGDYYYVKVLQADSSGSAGQAISSPIFCTSMKNDGNQTVMICHDSCVILQSNVSGGTYPYTYSWSPSTGLSSATASNPLACPVSGTIYHVTVTDATGCSVKNSVTVSIKLLPAGADTISGATKVCSGINAVTYSVPKIANAESYIWRLPSNSIVTTITNSITINYDSKAVSGDITVRGHNSCGDGDSSSLAITVYPSYKFTENLTICGGNIYKWQGNDYTTSGTYSANYNSINGCDSIYSLHLTVNPVFSFTEKDSICDGDTYNWRGTDYIAAGIYTANYYNIYGCDSIYILRLTVNPVYSFTEDHTICKGDIYNWHGADYTVAGNYHAAYTTIKECDSTYTLNLTVDSVDTGVTVSGNTITADSSADTYQWLDCDHGFAIISGEVNRSFTPIKNGNYAVKVTRGLCNDVSVCILINSAGITVPEAAKAITIYTNPVEDQLTIVLKGNTKNTKFEILNSLGLVVFKGYISEKMVVQTSSFAPGLYIIKIKNGNSYEIKKIIKE
jgi:hypothetical protein